MGTKWEQQDMEGILSGWGVNIEKERRGEERRRCREKIHFKRDQADFGVHLYE